MRDIRAIRSEADLDWAIAEVSAYFIGEPEPGSEDAERFQVLTDLIEAYENKHFAIDPIEDPIEFLKHFMELAGHSQADLGKVLGSRSRASEILLRKRALTLDMIRELNKAWGIPADNLARKYDLAAA